MNLPFVWSTVELEDKKDNLFVFFGIRLDSKTSLFRSRTPRSPQEDLNYSGSKNSNQRTC